MARRDVEMRPDIGEGGDAPRRHASDDAQHIALDAREESRPRYASPSCRKGESVASASISRRIAGRSRSRNSATARDRP